MRIHSFIRELAERRVRETYLRNWAALAACAIALLLVLVGCATPNTGNCPPEYRSTELRNEGKLVLWCLR